VSISSQSQRHTSALSPEYALLGLLAQGPAHGYELHHKLSAELGQVWHLSLSQAYNILNRLEVKGYIAGALQEQEKLPARRLFHLTAQGRERFERWLEAASGSSVRSIRLEFLTRLYFARQIDARRAHRLIETQIAETHRGLERLTRLHEGIPGDQLVNRLGLELRIRQLESILGWLEGCRQAMEQAPSPESP
jgi:DNA-binding PadR family transcriptional regulator